MASSKRDKQQLLETQTDMKLLLDCLDYQGDSPSAMKQALVTLSSMLQGSDSARDLFHEAGGIQRVLDVTSNTKYDEVVEVGLYCLGSAVERNVCSQKLLSSASVFTFLHGILSNTKSSIKKKQTAAFLLICLISNNGFGQALARQSSCLHDIITLIRITLPRSSRTGLSTSSNNDANIALWSALLNAASVCVNNPLNEENQRICVSLLPYLLSVLPGLREEKTISPLLSLIGLTVSNSEHNQERIRQCGGLEVFVNKLQSVQHKLSEDCSHLRIAIHLISVLDYCITDNEMSSKRLGFLGGLKLIMQILLEQTLDDQDKTQAILTLAHAVDAYDDNKTYITDGGGIALLIQKLTETADVELSNTIKYLLHMCVAAEKTPADDMDESEMEPLIANMEKMKRRSDMEVLRKINELDSKLKMMEKPAVVRNDFTDQHGEISCDGDNQSFTATLLQRGRTPVMPEYVARSTCSSVNGRDGPARCQTPRELSLAEQLIKEKMENKRLERLNQMLHEDICISRGSTNINVPGCAAMPVGAGHDRMEVADEIECRSANGSYIPETRIRGRKQLFQSRKCWETEEQEPGEGNEEVQNSINNLQNCMTSQLGIDTNSRCIPTCSTNASLSHTKQDPTQDRNYGFVRLNLQNNNASYSRCTNIDQQTVDNRGSSTSQTASKPGGNREEYTTVPFNVNQRKEDNQSFSANQPASKTGWSDDTTVPFNVNQRKEDDQSFSANEPASKTGWSDEVYTATVPFNVNQQTAANGSFSANKQALQTGRNDEVYTVMPINVNQQRKDSRDLPVNQRALNTGRNDEDYRTMPRNDEDYRTMPRNDKDCRTMPHSMNQQRDGNRGSSANRPASTTGCNGKVCITVPLDLSSNSHSDISAVNVQVPPSEMYSPVDLSSAQVPSDQICSRPYDVSLNEMPSNTNNVGNHQSLTLSSIHVHASDAAQINCAKGHSVQKITSSKNAEIQCGTPLVCNKEQESVCGKRWINECTIHKTCHLEDRQHGSGSHGNLQVNEACQTEKTPMVNQHISSKLKSASKQDISKILQGHKQAVQKISPSKSVVSLKSGKGDKTLTDIQGERGQGILLGHKQAVENTSPCRSVVCLKRGKGYETSARKHGERGQGDSGSVRGQSYKTSVRDQGNSTSGRSHGQGDNVSDRGQGNKTLIRRQSNGSPVGTERSVSTDKNRSTTSMKLSNKLSPVVVLTDVLHVSSAETSDESEPSQRRRKFSKSTAANTVSRVTDTDSPDQSATAANNDKSNIFLKPIAAPLKRRVRMTPRLGSDKMPILRGVSAKERSQDEDCMSDILTEFDANLIKKVKGCMPQSNVEQSKQTKAGVRPVVIKSQNNVRSIDRQLEARNRNVADNWTVAPPVTPRQQQIRPVRPAFSDCGMRRLALRSPSSLQSAHAARKVSMDDSGIHSPRVQGDTVFPISPGGFSEDTDVEGCRSNSDESDEDPSPSINVNVLRSRQGTKPNKNDKCPETDANTCRRHRELRTQERRIQRDKKRQVVRQHTGRLLDPTVIARQSRQREKRKGSVYEFRSDSDRPELSPASNTEEEPGWYLPPKRCKPRRERVAYTNVEEANLREGVRRLGKYWNQILNTYQFHPSRTNVDLKDKYRRMMAAENRDTVSLATTARVRPFSMCEERRLKRGVQQFGYNWQKILKSFSFSRGRSTEELRNRWRCMYRGQGIVR